MCLAIPAQIIKVSEDGQWAECSISGVDKAVNVSLIEDPRAGDWVVVHVGFALNKIDEEEAAATLQLFAEASSRS